MKKDEKFFCQLENKLDEFFPKLNQKNPIMKSLNRRGEALALFAFANLYHNEILTQKSTDLLKKLEKEKESLTTEEIESMGRLVEMPIDKEYFNRGLDLAINLIKKHYE